MSRPKTENKIYLFSDRHQFLYGNLISFPFWLFLWFTLCLSYFCIPWWLPLKKALYCTKKALISCLQTMEIWKSLVYMIKRNLLSAMMTTHSQARKYVLRHKYRLISAHTYTFSPIFRSSTKLFWTNTFVYETLIYEIIDTITFWKQRAVSVRCRPSLFFKKKILYHLEMKTFSFHLCIDSCSLLKTALEGEENVLSILSPWKKVQIALPRHSYEGEGICLIDVTLS